MSLEREYLFLSIFLKLNYFVTTGIWCCLSLLTLILLFTTYWYPSLNSLFRSDHPFEDVVIALVGKYTKFEDSYMSVIKALKHSAMACRKTLVVKVRLFLPDMFVL